MNLGLATAARRAGARWHYHRSLASRVTLLTTLAVGISIAAIALGVYFVLRIQLQANMDDSLLRRARSTAEDAQIVVNWRTGDTVPTWALNAGDVEILEVGLDGYWTPSQGDFPEPGAPEFAVAAGKSSSEVRTITTKTDVYRAVTVPLAGTNDEALMLAQSLEPQERMYRRLGLVVLFFGAAGVIVAGLAGWAVANGSLRPVRRLTAAVKHSADTEDLTPLPVDGDDEIASLTSSFNDLLAAVARSQERQRQLVADASHELRTPLTSLRTNIELLTQADESLDRSQRAELLGDIRAQIEELTTLIGDLVELARDEPQLPVVEAVDLVDVLDSALARVRLRAPTVTFEVDAESWWVLGEAGSLERAVTNLLDNAAKWSPADGTVRVRLAAGTLTVDDEGPGIPIDDRPLVFDRFYRATESRAMPGSGLGLAIVRQVAERAGGTVHADRAPSGGARLVLHLPGSPLPMPTRTPTGAPLP
ncbi:MAG: HAMP domain-containing sensor histidine kinase [Nocardioides sp.]|uniref:HAMP domain-containing sensor histidine kinase n=1 Tax=Nocardioides sp. TaxID=35761 RepID=UPI0039E235FB